MERKVAFHLGELEAVLFASPRPLSVRALARRLGLSEKEVSWLIERYGEESKALHRGIQLREALGGWTLATKLLYEDVVRAARAERGELPLSAAALETLAVVALHAPLTTRDVNQRRGRDSTPVLQTLQERKLIRRSSDSFGAAGRWSTTEQFIALVGLRSLNELHRPETYREVFENLRSVGRTKRAQPID